MKRRILLVEDDVDEQMFFQTFLADRTDFTLLPPVGDGEELFGYLERMQEAYITLPDAIILDQNMPKMSGLQALSLLKTNDGYKNIPVLLYSTYIDTDLQKRCVNLGANLVVTKPQDSIGYHIMIDKLLKLLR